MRRILIVSGTLGGGAAIAFALAAFAFLAAPEGRLVPVGVDPGILRGGALVEPGWGMAVPAEPGIFVDPQPAIDGPVKMPIAMPRGQPPIDLPMPLPPVDGAEGAPAVP